MITSLLTPNEVISKAAFLVKQGRLDINITQKQLADRSGVSISVLRKFERTGKISLESFVRLIFTLGLTENFLNALKKQREAYSSIDELLQEEEPTRKHAYPSRKKE